MLCLDIGRREQGKTTLAVFGLEHSRAPRLIFDPRGMVQRGSRVDSPELLAGGFAELVGRDRQELAYRPPGSVQYGFALFSWYVRQWVERWPSRRLGVLVDEAAFVNLEIESFQWVLRCCQRDRVNVWITGHRPNDVSTKVRAIADYWYLFAARQEHDLKVIEERCGPVVAGAVQKLGARQFVAWNDAAARHAVYSNPRQWYVSLTGRELQELPQAAPVILPA